MLEPGLMATLSAALPSCTCCFSAPGVNHILGGAARLCEGFVAARQRQAAVAAVAAGGW